MKHEKSEIKTIHTSIPLLSTYSKLSLTLHIDFFQFHVLYAAYVSYLIKRIWYGMVQSTKNHVNN